MKKMLKKLFKWEGLTLFLLMFALNVNAQTIAVRGTVVDEQGEPAIGAMVQVRGTGIGTMVDFNGNFTLNAPQGGVLVVSFFGFNTEEVPVSAEMHIVLQSDVEFLDELVVIGYGTVRRSEITAAVSHLTREDFNTISSPNVMELVRGRFPGLVVTSASGTDPRQGASLQIRGVGTLRGSVSPLIVIDGVPNADLSTVAPEDIESFSILRDAAAAAIYGTRGANGVILITTRRAARGGQPTRFEFSSSFSHETVKSIPNVLTAEEYRQWMRDGGHGSQNMIDHGYNNDWTRVLVNSGNLSQTHNFSASGGSQHGNYRVALYYIDNNPIAIRSNQTRWGGRFNSNFIGLNDRLEFQFNTSVDFRSRDRVNPTGGGAWEQVGQVNPTMPFFQPDGTHTLISGWGQWNPMERFDTMVDYCERLTWMGSARATVNIMPGFRISTQANRHEWREYRNQYWFQDALRSVDDLEGGGRAQKWFDTHFRQSIETTMDFHRVFNNIHSFNAVAGHSYEFATWQGFNAWNSLFISDAFRYNNLGAGQGLQRTGTARSNMGSSKSSFKIAAFFGRINYVFMNRYQFSATLRREGSSRFGARHRWGNFPAVSAGWVLSQENFIRDNFEFIDFLQLRGGFGVTGSMPTDDFLFMPTFGTGGMYIVPGTGGQWAQTYGPNRNPNPYLRWERREEFNVGLEYALFNRLRGSIDVYRRMTRDLLEDVRAPQPSMMHATMMANVGTIMNYGVELGLTANVIDNRNFSWDVAVTYFYQRNRLVSLSNDQFFANYRTFGDVGGPGALGNLIRTEVGAPLGQFFGRRFAGLTEPGDARGEGRWLFYNIYGEAVTNDQIDHNRDRTWIGNGVPPHHASLINNFRFGNFDFSFMFRGKFGFDIFNSFDMNFGNLNQLPNNVLRSAITTHANLREAAQISDYYVERGDFVKLDNITLGYTIRFANRDWVRHMRVFAAANNVATFTGFTGLTPEVQDTGLTTGIAGRTFFPVSRTFILGFNVGF